MDGLENEKKIRGKLQFNVSGATGKKRLAASWPIIRASPCKSSMRSRGAMNKSTRLIQVQVK